LRTAEETIDTATFQSAIGGGDTVIAKFQTKSCVICRRIEPGMKVLRERLRIIDIDAEDSAEVADRYHIRSVPTLILFKDGRELSRCNGFQSVGMLRQWVAPFLDG